MNKWRNHYQRSRRNKTTWSIYFLFFIKEKDWKVNSIGNGTILGFGTCTRLHNTVHSLSVSVWKEKPFIRVWEDELKNYTEARDLSVTSTAINSVTVISFFQSWCCWLHTASKIGWVRLQDSFLRFGYDFDWSFLWPLVPW